MGTINQGILGGFSGKVGSVIGASWKGINYMRTRAVSTKDAHTEKQLNQRAKFTLGMDFLRPMKAYLREGYKGEAHRCSTFNAALSYVVRIAVDGKYPELKIDYAKVLVSRGSLIPVADASASLNNGKVEFKWTDNSGQGDALATDIAMPLVYNTTKKIVIFNTQDNLRSSGKAELSIPVNWAGDTLQIYLGMISVDGKTSANSIYLSEAQSEEGGNTGNDGNTGDGTGKDDDPLG